MRAAFGGHVDVIERLLDAGADPVLRSEKDETARSIARAQGHEEAARVLMCAAE